MAVYLMVEVQVTDDAWIPDYAAQVHDIVARYQGRYLSRSGNIETLEGEQGKDTLIALIQFPTRDDALAFVNAPEYAPFSAARQAGSVSRVRLMDDTDLAGTIPYLGKAG
ncbi:MAG: DUF1330 domain-containing protein [Lautropia sp.]|nr:DUF1330 domain-containing protein [Lautropia sp.]